MVIFADYYSREMAKKPDCINRLIHVSHHVEEPILNTKIHNTTLSLPISFIHSETDLIQVVEALNKF